MEQNFIENELVILTKATLDHFLHEKNPADLIALYTFYYYTAKWQKTNQPKATTNYAMKGLHWGEKRLMKVKKQLINFGLIEDIKTRDIKTGEITGWYIKVNYIFKKSTLADIKGVVNSSPGETQPVVPEGTNALNTNILNALSTDNKNALSSFNKRDTFNNEDLLDNEDTTEIGTDDKESLQGNDVYIVTDTLKEI
jgi:hypothetical protein